MSAASLCRPLGSLHSTHTLETLDPGPQPARMALETRDRRRQGVCEDSSATTVRHLQRCAGSCLWKQGSQTRAAGFRRLHTHGKPRKAAGRVELDWSRPVTQLPVPGRGHPSGRWRLRSALAGAVHQTRCLCRPAEQLGLRLGPQLRGGARRSRAEKPGPAAVREGAHSRASPRPPSQHRHPLNGHLASKSIRTV